jgi:hypothetical protein
LDGIGGHKEPTRGFELKLLEAFQDKPEETSREKGKGKMTFVEAPPVTETIGDDGVYPTPTSALAQTNSIEVSYSPLAHSGSHAG